MNSDQARLKIEFHAQEAQRLLQHPLVGEFNHHVQSAGKLRQVLPEIEKKEAEAKAKEEKAAAKAAAKAATKSARPKAAPTNKKKN